MDSRAKRRVVRAGRRGGKTTGVGGVAARAFLAGARVLYGGPTKDQLDHFWSEVTWILESPIDAGIFHKHQGKRLVEIPGTRRRIRAKTVWNPDHLRGDYCDLLILDEFQLMNEQVWEVVAQPMLGDTDGDAIFVFTPPSHVTRTLSKAKDKLHATKLYRRYEDGHDPDWETFTFTSLENPHVSKAAFARMRRNMSTTTYKQEVLAEDLREVPGALWKRYMVEDTRVDREPEDLLRVVVGVDPPGGATECGIVVVVLANCRCSGDWEKHAFVVSDASLRSSPKGWSKEVLRQYDGWEADRVIGEINYGGDMVEHTLRTARDGVPFTKVHASRGKAVRADPVVALYEQGRVHHVGEFPKLEKELMEWVPGEPNQESPNRMDALVWALWELMLRRKKRYVWTHAGANTGDL